MKKNWIAKMSLIMVLGSAPVALTLPASAATAPAPGTGMVGACNMLLDPTMGTVPMVKDIGGNGNAGMFHAVDVSGCS